MRLPTVTFGCAWLSLWALNAFGVILTALTVTAERRRARDGGRAGRRAELVPEDTTQRRLCIPHSLHLQQGDVPHPGAHHRRPDADRRAVCFAQPMHPCYIRVRLRSQSPSGRRADILWHYMCPLAATGGLDTRSVLAAQARADPSTLAASCRFVRQHYGIKPGVKL